MCIRDRTLVNGERFITEKLKKIEEEITGANEKLVRLEYQLFEDLREEVLKYTDSIQQTAQYLAQLDCLRSLGEAALVNRYCRPEIDTGAPIEIKMGRHPVIEKMDLGERFVPNHASLDENRKMLIPVSYTHLDVYKRQDIMRIDFQGSGHRELKVVEK